MTKHSRIRQRRTNSLSMFRSSQKKIFNTIFLLSALLFVSEVKICSGQGSWGHVPEPEVVDNDLIVTKSLSVGRTPGALAPVTPPATKLWVNGAISSGDLNIGPWPPNPGKYVYFGANALNQLDPGNYALLQHSGSGEHAGTTFLNSPSEIRFRIKNYDQMILTSDGRVGIGTSDPDSDLSIVGTGSFPGYAGASISLRGGNNNSIGLTAGDTYFGGETEANSIRSNQKLTISSADGTIRLKSPTGVVIGRPISSGLPGGNGLGLDAFEPTAELDVIGDISVRDVDVWDGTDDNDLTWNGLQITREGSSRRYKQNIEPLQADFQKILDLDPKQYQMKEGFGTPEKWLFGYIAEDLDELGLGKLCIYDEEGRPDGVKYKKVPMYTLEVVKEQQKRIEQLEESLKRIENKLAEVLENNV